MFTDSLLYYYLYLFNKFKILYNTSYNYERTV